MAKHNELGKQGEDAAVEFLLQNGHIIIARNFRFGKAEVDIISQDESIVVFTEVKTRSSNFYGNPEEFIDMKKQLLMQQAADEFLYVNKIDKDIRFDTISVSLIKNKIKVYHIKDAFFC